jgi:hypothetical protein
MLLKIDDRYTIPSTVGKGVPAHYIHQAAIWAERSCSCISASPTPIDCPHLS